MKRKHVYLLCQMAGWALLAVANMIFSAVAGVFSSKTIVIYAWGACAAILATHQLRRYLRSSGWLALPPLRALPRAFLASLVTGVIITALVTLAWPPVMGFRALKNSGFAWIFPAVFVWSICVFLWIVLYFGIHYFEGFERAEVEKLRLEVVAKDAQFRALLSQVNPHFLFNCLNSLRGLIHEDPLRAQNMVTELSSILRYSLQSGSADTVPLEAELEAVNAYLKLEAMRLEERLRVRMEIDPQSREMRIPPMILQTLVENGVKHGVARLPQGGEICVASRIEDGALKIDVCNSGQLQVAGGGTHLGLINARERLRLVYGQAATLILRNLDAQCVVAEVTVPARTGG